jgi:lipid A ethanolaminephosphotransferase
MRFNLKLIFRRLLGFNEPIDPLWSALMMSVWLATFANAALWAVLYKLPDVNGVRGGVLLCAMWLTIAAALFALQSLVAGRWSTKVVGIVLLLVSAPAMYFMYSYGVVIDVTMLKNAMQTDAKETRDLMSPGLTACVLVVALLPSAWLILRRHSNVRISQRLMSNIVCAIAALLIAVLSVFAVKGDVATLMRNNTKIRYLITPFNVLYGLGRLAIGEAKALPFESLGAANVEGAPSLAIPVLALVVGETARADHFSLNGYSRPTNSALAQQSVLSFTNAWSCGTNTADSVPCMFSHLGRDSFFSRKANYDNALDLLQTAGYSVLWIDNNSGCKGVCDRVLSEDASANKHPVHCTAEGCFDEALSSDLAKRILALRASKPASKGVVVVLHQLGSHGPAYFKRSPETAKPFTPECKTNVLQNCDTQSIVNAYDNSIAYTDRVLASVVKELKNLPSTYAPAMVYMSDHGESLGESGTYLHGLPYAIAPDTQKRVPLIMWLSPVMQQQRGIKSECMKTQTGAKLSHDYLFHSVLSLMNVRTASYKAELDWFKPCL